MERLQERRGLNENIVIAIFAIILHFILEENPGPCPTYCAVDHKHNINIEELVDEQ